MDIGQIHINIIDNKNNRLNSLISLFTNIYDNGAGKLVEDKYFIIETDKILTQDKDKESMTFNILQRESNRKGILFNMFIIKEDE